jgi:hypothetical protein
MRNNRVLSTELLGCQKEGLGFQSALVLFLRIVIKYLIQIVLLPKTGEFIKFNELLFYRYEIWPGILFEVNPSCFVDVYSIESDRNLDI